MNITLDSLGQIALWTVLPLTHSGDKMHKLFGLAGNVKRHMVIHSKERPHACVQCNKSFGRAEHLITHLLTHRGKYFFIFQSNKERDMRQLNTLPVGELIPAKPALPVHVTQAQTIGYFQWDS